MKLRLSVAVPAAMLAVLLGGCAHFLPGTGPSEKTVQAAPSQASLKGIEVIPVNYTVARELERDQMQRRFSSVFRGAEHPEHLVGPGDVLQVYIWEAPPAMLFTAQAVASAGLSLGGSGMVSLPAQTVDNSGDIAVPFAGRIHAAGLSLSQVEALVTKRLKGMANHPQVLVALAQNNTQNVTVVGNVQHSMELPLNPGGLRLLRALALAGGITRPVEKTSIQISRDGRVMTLPLQTILRDPRQNIALRAGDVVTALYQPSSFTVLGAAGRNAEIDFEASGISLAQALARAGGVDGSRSNPSGVFVFRFESPDALHWPKQPTTLVDGKVPTIFQFDLRDPATFFVAQSFPVQDHDLLYVSDSPSTDLQRVLGVVGSIVYPFASLQNLGVIH
jgi:polysaccharide export outer membrane protein